MPLFQEGSRRDLDPSWVPNWVPGWYSLSSLSNGVSASSTDLQRCNDDDEHGYAQSTLEISQSSAVHIERQDISTQTGLLVPRPALTARHSPDLRSVSSQTISSLSEGTTGLVKTPSKVIVIKPSLDRTVRRSLEGIHIFMITINATIGTGLYWRGGQVLELGGPLAVVLSFLLVGFLSWSVMQCVSEMLCIWPIPGALSAYVSEFVDVELGIATGVAYWFTYSISFSTLIATSAAEFNFWPSIQESTGIHAGILYLLIPVAIVCANSLEIEIYGIIEVITGTIKLLLLAVIICVLIAINRGVGLHSDTPIGFKYWKSATEFDSDAAGNWFAALLIGMSIATFSFVGIEIVAASALEAKWPRQDHKSKVSSSLNITPRPNDTLIGNQIKFSAIFISVLATVVYVVAAFLVTLDIYRGDCALPRVSWLSEDIKSNCTAPGSKAAFVAIALESGIPHLADLFNVFLIFTCLTCTSTNLYVASRTLFGLTSGLEGGKGQRWYLRILAWFGKTNRHQVPIRAVIFSAVSFSWVPFLQLIGKPDTRSSINEFIEILSQMASIGVLIVWGMNCLAFLRYHKCISVHENQKIFKARGVPQFQRDDYSEYPYRSHGQPLLAYFAFSGCFFLLIVAGGAALWKSWNLLPFLASYLPVLAFFALWVLLKIARRAPWGLVDLSDGHMVATKLQRLHEIRGATQI